ncbi:MAG: hypothetical protein K2I10_06260 [Lachnospiraceae bacterium]|nr:hypothetical protein [Lachnospiraceae bacterium]
MGALGAGLAIYYIVALAISIVMLVALWKVFVKAGEPGWAAIVPIYNIYVLFKIAMGNGWLFLLCFVPLVGAILALIVYFKLATAFGKGAGFGIGMIFLTPIFLCMLAFGDAEYQGA